MKPEEYFQGQRWIPVKDLGLHGEVPPFAIVQISFPYEDGTVRSKQISIDSSLDLGESSASGANTLAVNGPTAIPAGGYGFVTRDWPAVCYLNSGVFAGDPIGTIANQYYMDTGTFGFMCWGMLDDGLSGGNRHGLVVPYVKTIPASDFGGFRPARRLKAQVSVFSGPDSGGIAGNRYPIICYPASSLNSRTHRWYGYLDANGSRTYLWIAWDQLTNLAVPTGCWVFLATSDAAGGAGTFLNEFSGSINITPADPFSHTGYSKVVGDATTIYQFDISPWDDP